MNGGRIDYSIGFRLEQGGLSELRVALQKIQQEASRLSGTGKLTKEFQESAQAAKKLESILNGAWNSKLQTFNLDKVNANIKKTYGSVRQLKKELEKSGSAGASAYNKLGSQLLTTNTQLRQTSKIMDGLAKSFTNTIKWGISSSVFNSMTRSVRQAWTYTKNLDTSLNNIRIVTGKSADEMEKFAKQANRISKDLGASTLDFTNASLIYYQQGLEAAEATARAETTVKAANVTGQTGDEVSEQLTAVWNGYQVSAEETEKYVDKLAAVAATTASDLEELSTGMSKVASAANMMGVDIDQLNGHLSTVISVTRQAPETVGTAFKTIYARLGDLAVGGEDEFGTKLGQVSSKMKQMGIEILDSEGQMREMGEVMEEVAGKWDTWTQAQKEAAAVAMAGKRQYNNLLALFENWDMYEKAVETSKNSLGTLQEQQDIYMESVAAHVKSLKTELQRTYDTMFESESVNNWIDALDTGLGFFNNFIEGINGGGKALTLFGAIAVNVFGKQIVNSLMRVHHNFQVFRAQIGNSKLKADLIALGVAQQNALSGVNLKAGTAGYQAQLAAAQQIFAVQKGLTQEQYQQSLEINKQIGLKAEELAQERMSRAINKEVVQNLQAASLSRNSSSGAVRAMIANEEIILTDLRIGKEVLSDAAATIQRINNGETTRKAVGKDILANEQALRIALGQSNLSTKDQERIVSNINQKYRENKLTVEDIVRIMKILDAEEAKVNGKIAAGNVLLKSRDPEAMKHIAQLEEELKILQLQNAEIAKQGQQSLRAQNFLNIGMAIMGTFASMSGAVSAFTDEMADTEQKVHAVGSAIGGMGMAIGSAFGPAGMVIGGVVGSLISMVSQLDFVEDAFKKTEERLEELQEKQQELIAQTKTHYDIIAQLSEEGSEGYEDIGSEFDHLSEKAGEYDKNIENLTETERSRYNELKSLILEYNPDALLAYNSENEAIIKKNESIQTTIDLLKEQYELETKDAFEKNWSEINSDKEKVITESKEKYNEAKNKKDNFTQEQADEVSENRRASAAAELAKYKSSEDDELAVAVDTFIKQAEKGDEEGKRYAESLLRRIEKNGNDSDEWQQIESLLNKYTDSFTYYEDQLAKLEDDFKIASLELENAEDLDTSFIADTLKYIDTYNTGWTKLGQLDLEDPESLLTPFLETLEFGKNGINSMADAYLAGDEYLNNLYEVLALVDSPDNFSESLEDFSKYDFSTIEEYNEGIKTEINSLIQNNIKDFKNLSEEQKEALAEVFESMFNISDISFGSDGLVNKLNTGYKSERQKVVSDWATDTDRDISKESINEMTFLGPEEIDNFAEIVDYLDEGLEKSKGIKEALQFAAERWKDEEGKEQFQADTAAQGDKYAEDYGFDAEDYKDLAENIYEYSDEIEDLNDNLKENGDVVQEIAKEILRYDKAAEVAAENSEDWMNALSGDNLHDQARVIDDVREAYGNLLDLDGSQLSDDFVKNVDNLELMNQALEGSEDAYNQLMEAAQLDIEEQQFKIYPSIDQEAFYAEKEAFQTVLDNLNFDDLEVGTSLDNTPAIAAMEEMVNAANMTATQAQQYLASMGVDAEVEEVSVESEDEHQYTGARAEVTENKVLGNDPTRGDEVEYNFPSVEYKVTPPVKGKDKKKTTATALKVTAANKSSGGGFKHKNSSHASGGKKKSSGGGGGGGSTTKKSLKTSEKKYDRYRNVNNSLKKLSTELDRLAEKQEKLFGKDLLDNLNKQLNVLEQQKEVTKEKLAIAEQEAAEMRKTSKKDNYKDENGYTRYNDLGDFGIEFDANGEITNYQTIMKDYDDKIAAKEAKWNSMSAKKQSKNKKLENEIAALTANRDTLASLVESYDTLLYETIPGLRDEITQAAYDQIEIKLEAFQIETDLRLDVTEARRDWADFEAELAELQFPDDLSKQLQPTMDYIRAELGDLAETTLIDGTKTTMTKTADSLYHHITTLTDDWQSWRDKGSEGYKGKFSATDANGNKVFDENAFREALEEDIEKIQEYVLNIEEDFEAIHEGYLDSIDAVIEGLDEELEVLEYIGNQLEHNVRMTELLKGENAYADMAENYAAQRTNNENILAEYEQRMAFLRQEIANTTDEDAKKVLEEEYRNTLENYEEALESAAELIQTEFENAVNLQLQKFDEALGTLNSNGDAIGTMGIKTQWEIDTNNAEKYLDTVEKTYGIQDFANKVKTSIADTNSISAQKKLNNLLDDQLEKLREKDKLTQYDLDRANALYEIELKKIALEEAQNNKSQMRLRRDASGNYSYQFVADQDGVAQAQQELLEAQNNLYALDKDTMKERQEELWDVYQEYQDLMVEYSQLSAEEREKYEDVYATKFADIQSRMTTLGKECADIQIDLAKSAASTMAQAYEDMGQGIDYTLEEIVPKWATGMDEMIAKINAPDGSFIAAMDETFKEIKELGKQAATDMKAIGQKSAIAYTAASEEAKKWQESVEATTEELTAQYDKLKAMNDEAVKHRDFWKEIEANIIAAAEAANNYNIAATGGEADEIQEGRTSDEGGTEGTGTGGTTGETGGTETGTGGATGETEIDSDKKELTTKRKKGIAEAIVRLDNFGGWGKGDTRIERINNKFKKVNDKTAYSVVQDYVEKLLSGAVDNSFTKKQLRNNYKYSHFDTGGYTGDWAGNMGKMAMLHKKELILNAKDTINILEAVKLLRIFADDYYKVQKEISSSSSSSSAAPAPMIENLATMMTSAIAINMNKMISSFEPISRGIESLTTEEKSDIINIEINADFPNANSAKEIEKAFLELTNIATQRVHSNKRG